MSVSVMPNHSHRHARFVAASAIALAAALAIAAADTPRLTSIIRPPHLKIDGANTEWPALAELPAGPAFSAANDGQSLALIVATSDQEMRLQLSKGVIVWFDPAGGKKQDFGIGIAAPTTIGRGGTTPPPPPSPAPREGGLIVPPTIRPENVLDAFDLYGPGKKQHHLIRLDPAFGIRVASAEREGTLVFELELPLAKTTTHPYAAGAGPDAVIGIGLTTPADAPARSLRGGQGRVEPGAGMGGGSMGRGGGLGGPRRGYDPIQNAPRYAPLDVWATLQLAAAK